MSNLAFHDLTCHAYMDMAVASLDQQYGIYTSHALMPIIKRWVLSITFIARVKLELDKYLVDDSPPNYS